MGQAEVIDFLKKGGEYSARDIAKVIKKSMGSTRKSLAVLVKHNEIKLREGKGQGGNNRTIYLYKKK